MTFNPDSPQGNDSPANQVVQVQTNFSTYATGFNSNHTNLNDVNEGNHASIIFEKQSNPPTIDDSFCVLYNKNAQSNLGTQPQLFLSIPKFLPTKLDPNSPGNPTMQLTYNEVNTTGPVYQSFLPGKYLLYFGQTSIANPQTSVTITLTPAPSTIRMAIAYANSTSGGASIPVSTNITSNNTFDIKTVLPPGSVPFTWIAIATA